MSTYAVTWSYRRKRTTENIEARSSAAAAEKLTRAVAKRLGARRRSIAIIMVIDVAGMKKAAHVCRMLAHQTAELAKLAKSERKPPKRVTR